MDPVPEQYMKNIKELACVLQVIRDHIKAPLVITSGYRGPVHNCSTKGSADMSHHTEGLAADVKARNRSPKELADLVIMLCEENLIHNLGEIGIYPTHLHLSIKGKIEIWAANGASVAEGQSNKVGQLRSRGLQGIA